MRAYRAFHLTEADEKRFWAKVALPDENGCMLWLAALDPIGGYGRFKMNGHEGRSSRASLQIAVGPPPSEFEQAAHSCRNRHCVAPAHLRWATPVENAADKVVDGTAAKGETHGRAKLSWSQVQEIREKKARGVPELQIAAEYSISKGLVWQIATGRIWAEQDGVAS